MRRNGINRWTVVVVMLAGLTACSDPLATHEDVLRPNFDGVEGAIVVTSLTDGGGSLREAIEEANVNAGSDVITFAVSGSLVFRSAMPDILPGGLVIDGGNAIVVEAASLVRPFTVASGAVAELRNITVANGHAISNGDDFDASDLGGGIQNNGTLTLTNCTFINNHVTGSRTGGGAVFSGSGTTLTVDNCTFSGNSADWWGGAIMANGTAIIRNSTFTGNTGDFGGAIAIGNLSSGTIINTTITGNAAVRGGGVWNAFGEYEIIGSRISNNTASFSGGGVYATTRTVATIISSTLDGNNAPAGGAIGNVFGTVNVFNSTLSGNIAGTGGAIDNLGPATFVNTTITGSIGGGISHRTPNDPFQLINSIVANSVSGPDCATNGGAVMTDGGNNLIEDGTCGFPAAGDPVIGPLADNGGPTPTHAVLAGSPAIDAAPGRGCVIAGVDGVDQRGVTRPQGAACDIGAFEFEGRVLEPVVAALVDMLNENVPDDNETLNTLATELTVALNAGDVPAAEETIHEINEAAGDALVNGDLAVAEMAAMLGATFALENELGVGPNLDAAGVAHARAVLSPAFIGAITLISNLDGGLAGNLDLYEPLEQAGFTYWDGDLDASEGSLHQFNDAAGDALVSGDMTVPQMAAVLGLSFLMENFIGRGPDLDAAGVAEARAVLSPAFIGAITLISNLDGGLAGNLDLYEPLEQAGFAFWDGDLDASEGSLHQFNDAAGDALVSGDMTVAQMTAVVGLSFLMENFIGRGPGVDEADVARIRNTVSPAYFEAVTLISELEGGLAGNLALYEPLEQAGFAFWDGDRDAATAHTSTFVDELLMQFALQELSPADSRALLALGDIISEGLALPVDVPTIDHEVDVMFDQARPMNQGPGIELNLQDLAGADVGSRNLDATATSIVRLSDRAVFAPQSRGNANPGERFRFAGKRYKYHLDAHDLEPGTYALTFTVEGDAIVYGVQFEVR